MKQWDIGWGLTSRCNLGCLHCYNNSGAATEGELSIDEIFEVGQKLIEFGIASINYGTGESTLREDFSEIVKFFHDNHIVQGLTTNGSSVNDSTIDLISESMNDIDVSLDYSDERRHNHFRGSKFAWKWAMNALELLANKDLPRSIVTCITSENRGEDNLNGLLDIAAEFDTNLRINWFRPTGRGKVNERFKLTPYQVHETFNYLISNADIVALPDPYFAALVNMESDGHCPCGITSFRITPNGNVVPCVYFTTEMTSKDIRSTDLKNIIESETFLAIQNRKPKYCLDCDYEIACGGGCASRAFFEFGDINQPDGYCYRKAGIPENPCRDIQIRTVKKGRLVHENYLCTILLQPRGRKKNG